MPIELGNNLPRVKVSNQTAIRKMIYHYGPIMRSAIVERLSLTLPTITTNINSMIAKGIVHEIDGVESSIKAMGRKANPVDIVDDSRFFMGVEMRRDSRHFCITNYRGKMVYSTSDHTSYANYDENVSRTSDIINQLLNSDIFTKKPLGGIGICLPGLIDRTQGILNIHNQYNWFDKNVREDIAKLTSYDGSITIENDACARAFGAQLFESNELINVASFIYLFIARGLSCPFILNNSNFISTPLEPGEIGYMIMDATKPRDAYGNTGNLSSLSGERSIVARSIEALKNGTAPILHKICATNDKPTICQILQAQESGETSITDIIHSSITYLGIAVANIDNFVHPEKMLVEARLFSNKQNRKLFLDTFYQNSIRPKSSAPNFIFVDYNELNGARGACAVAIKTDLETYIQ